MEEPVRGTKKIRDVIVLFAPDQRQWLPKRGIN